MKTQSSPQPEMLRLFDYDNSGIVIESETLTNIRLLEPPPPHDVPKSNRFLLE